MPANDAIIYVCTTCRSPDAASDIRPGAQLFANLQAHDPALNVVAVECLSVCKRPCTIAFAAPGKWTYVYGDLPADVSADAIAAGAALYAQTADGLIPWKQRPDALKKGVVARIPPLMGAAS